ncbi:MAG: carboxypeptidase-like regulatory domain-containing protein, partial [Formivibrio sp.]|nr:carboxypeptidase-like regulatory domain-containing protein [Formivibrio sp.]
MLLVIAFLVLQMFSPGALPAQTLSTSQISGHVADPAGLALSRAVINLVNVETSATLTVTTDPSGFYMFPDLRVGKYELKAEMPGFRTYLQSGINLQVDVNPQINIQLQVGAQTEEVNVYADASMVETHSVGVGQVIDAQRIVDLPLNGRQVYQLVTLAGAAVSGPAIDSRHYPTDGEFSV